MRNLQAASLALAGLLSVSLLAGCLSDSYSSGRDAKWGNDSLRSVEGRVYTDHEFRYSLEFPAGWTLRPNYGGWEDFRGQRKGGHEYVNIQHRAATDAPLHDQVLDRFGGLDSTIVLAPILRDGMEVVIVESREAPESGKGPLLFWRYLNFRRDDVWIEICLSTQRLDAASLARLEAIDSSLTFF